MSHSYVTDDKVGLINAMVEDVYPWVWPKGDEQCWEIISKEWENFHVTKWFEHVKKFDVVVQAGGNCGLYPRLLAKRFNWVYTFEPDPMNFFCLSYNCQLDNIIKLNAALAHTRGLMGWARVTGNTGMSRHSENHPPRIPVMKLDDLNLFELDLLALDMEGMEWEALHGAAETIARLKPTIICEYGERVEEYLKLLGYIPVDKSKDDVIYVALEKPPEYTEEHPDPNSCC